MLGHFAARACMYVEYQPSAMALQVLTSLMDVAEGTLNSVDTSTAEYRRSSKPWLMRS